MKLLRSNELLKWVKGVDRFFGHFVNAPKFQEFLNKSITPPKVPVFNSHKAWLVVKPFSFKYFLAVLEIHNVVQLIDFNLALFGLLGLQENQGIAL